MGPCLIEGAGKDIQGVLLLHQLHCDAVKEAPCLLVMRCPVLCQVLHYSKTFSDILIGTSIPLELLQCYCSICGRLIALWGRACAAYTRAYAHFYETSC